MALQTHIKRLGQDFIFFFPAKPMHVGKVIFPSFKKRAALAFGKMSKPESTPKQRNINMSQTAAAFSSKDLLVVN